MYQIIIFFNLIHFFITLDIKQMLVFQLLVSMVISFRILVFCALKSVQISLLGEMVLLLGFDFAL